MLFLRNPARLSQSSSIQRYVDIIGLNSTKTDKEDYELNIPDLYNLS